MEASVARNGFDCKKLPLNDLQVETIKEGFKILNLLENVINKTSSDSIEDLCGKFYSFIPHDFGRKKMINFLIDTTEKLKDKQDLL